MESYQSGAREADFQKLAQNIGTNIQKILQNGTKIKVHFWLQNWLTFFVPSSFFNAANDRSNRNTTRQPAAPDSIVTKFEINSIKYCVDFYFYLDIRSSITRDSLQEILQSTLKIWTRYLHPRVTGLKFVFKVSNIFIFYSPTDRCTSRAPTLETSTREAAVWFYRGFE